MKTLSQRTQKLKKDLFGIFLLGLSVFIGLSLYSFDPNDPSFNSLGRPTNVSNYFGYFGSFLSDLLYQFFGISAWIFVFILFFLSIQYFFKSDSSLSRARPVWGSMILLVSSGLLSIHLPSKTIFHTQIQWGGILGGVFSGAMIQVFNPIGVLTILWFSLIALCILFFEKPLNEFYQVFPKTFIATSQLIQYAYNKTIGLIIKRSSKHSKEFKLSNPTRFEEMNSPFEKGFFPLNTNALAFQINELTKDDTVKDITPLSLASNATLASNVFSLNNSLTTNKSRDTFQVSYASQQDWVLPKLSLLDSPPTHQSKIDEKEIKKKSDILKNKLEQFGVTGEVVMAKPGPAVTLFEFKPNANVKLSRITELEDDLALALSSESLRIIAPIPGRDVVGIETSNSHREIVYLKDLLTQDQFWSEEIKLPIPLGKQVNGEPQIIDLRKMPHLMVAGTTGSGKSVFIVGVITSLILKHSPKTLRVILMDPKQVDLAAFENLPHLILPVVTDSKQAVMALKWAVQEMEKRYRSMSLFGARGLESFNEKVFSLQIAEIENHKKANEDLKNKTGDDVLSVEDYYYTPQPYIAIIVEEFGDLMSVDKATVEQYIVRLAQKARACGIHLILAMQSPRKEVITGLIKTNIPGRISFKVLSSMDSRIILDESGAERLLAQGDMLFRNPSGSNLIRYHGPFIKDSEIIKIAQFWSDQAKPEYNSLALEALKRTKDSLFDLRTFTASNEGQQEYDDRYDEILTWASTQKEISASLIQRRFQLGYPRAARIIETFEREGIVSPANGAKPRQVLIGTFPT